MMDPGRMRCGRTSYPIPLHSPSMCRTFQLYVYLWGAVKHCTSIKILGLFPQEQPASDSRSIKISMQTRALQANNGSVLSHTANVKVSELLLHGEVK